MHTTPSIDLSCARCGATRIYQLVPLAGRPTVEEAQAIPHAIPSIDLTCSRCGASQTYKLVPDAVAQASDRDRHETAVPARDATTFDDPTQGRTVGEQPYEDPTQGREIGARPHEDPIQTG
jgi:hypothetical protein